MKVFITGGTGYMGSVLVEHLTQAGHAVTALARSEASMTRLERVGATPVVGSLSDTTVLSVAAAQADAIIHAAVDYSMTAESNARELAAVSALVGGAGSAGTGKPVVFTSTGLVYGFEPDQDVTEDAVLPEVSAQPMKVATEKILLAAPGLTAIVLRAGLIFGRGGSALLIGLINAAQRSGVATYIEEGTNTWLPVHVDDLAELYTRVVAAPAPGNLQRCRGSSLHVPQSRRSDWGADWIFRHLRAIERGRAELWAGGTHVDHHQPPQRR